MQKKKGNLLSLCKSGELLFTYAILLFFVCLLYALKSICIDIDFMPYTLDFSLNFSMFVWLHHRMLN